MVSTVPNQATKILSPEHQLNQLNKARHCETCSTKIKLNTVESLLKIMVSVQMASETNKTAAAIHSILYHSNQNMLL